MHLVQWRSETYLIINYLLIYQISHNQFLENSYSKISEQHDYGGV